MTAEEIAETLINGNLSAARWNLLHDDLASVDADVERPARDAATLALDVLAALVVSEDAFAWHDAVNRLRRCLDPHEETHR